MYGGRGDCIVGLPALTLDPYHGSKELGGLILRDNPGLAWLALAALASVPHWRLFLFPLRSLPEPQEFGVLDWVRVFLESGFVVPPLVGRGGTPELSRD